MKKLGMHLLNRDGFEPKRNFVNFTYIIIPIYNEEVQGIGWNKR